MNHECLNCGNTLVFASEGSPYEGCPKCGCRLFSYVGGQPPELDVETAEKAEDVGDARAGRGIVEEVETVLLELDEVGGGGVLEDLKFNLESIKVKGDGVFEISLDKLAGEKPLIVELKEGKYHVHLSSLFGASKKRIDLEDLDI
ncbi:hypothetical protein AKJ38_03660 [candidate division MSBL1 archaeon SCGC-AAA259I14]|uniref:Zn-ribbon containing protein n=1 Tax=candidate division MSBL1 archaeon SCGC-AAA259I14 TaxID=1698268 RepID=A0A133UPU5_9EURY|nr:hypothetical protein AKJ38_03660 [candidate division MSBL1 archaeon SCGC-AAA259I14]